MKETVTTSVMSSPNTEAKTPGAAQTQKKMPPCPSGVLHSHSAIHAFCILVERCLASSNTVIPKGDFLSKCKRPTAMKHRTGRPGDTLGSWTLYPRTSLVKAPGGLQSLAPKEDLSHWRGISGYLLNYIRAKRTEMDRGWGGTRGGM